MQILMAPFMEERYHSDIYFLLGILTFLSIGFYGKAYSFDSKIINNTTILYISLITIYLCVIYFLIPHDKNFTAYNADFFDVIKSILTLGAL